jgi:hypothetical protein
MDTDKALWIVWGRQVRPGTFVLSVVTLALGINALAGATVLTGMWETIAGGIGCAAAAALWVGWWARSLTALLAGLLAAAWTWATVAAAAASTPGVNPLGMSVASAACWCLLACGLWLRDRRETQ